jgi:hypothetical protein
MEDHMHNSERRSIWQEHIKRNDEMGISAAKYAKRHNLKLGRYYFWRQKLSHLDRGNHVSSKLMPITMAKEDIRRLSFTVDSNGDLIISGADRDQVALTVSTLLR